VLALRPQLRDQGRREAQPCREDDEARERDADQDEERDDGTLFSANRIAAAPAGARDARSPDCTARGLRLNGLPRPL
jgi:hypothetical protein